MAQILLEAIQIAIICFLVLLCLSVLYEPEIKEAEVETEETEKTEEELDEAC
jgi:hypothetical protein